MNNDMMSRSLANLSPVCLIRMLLRHLWMIVVAALIFAMGSTLFTQWFDQPVYRASMTYVVTSRESSYITNRNLTATREVAAVMTELLATDVIVSDIRASSEELKDFDGTVSASQVGESNLISVSVQSQAPEDAFKALGALIDIFPSLTEYISNKCVVQVIQNPTISATPINQVDTRRNAMIAGAAGAVLMAVILCWLHIRRETVQTSRGARQLLDADIVAAVGHERKNRTLKSALQQTKKGVQIFAPSTSYAYTEQINNICARLEHEMVAHGHKIFLVTGVGENEGKSTIAGNVAAMLAMKGRNVALVDGDLRKPALNRFFEGAYQSELPLNEMLAIPYTRSNFRECAVRHDALGLYMLFSDKASSRSMELLTGAAMKTMMQQLQVFDCVIVDSPPMGFFADALALADMVDASMLVVRQDYTSACDINDAVDALKNTKSSFLGCILNDMRGRAGSRYGYGYGYGYGYAEKHGSSRSREKSGS